MNNTGILHAFTLCKIIIKYSRDARKSIIHFILLFTRQLSILLSIALWDIRQLQQGPLFRKIKTSAFVLRFISLQCTIYIDKTPCYTCCQ